MNKTNSWVMYIGALMVAVLFSQFTVLGIAVAEEQVETETYVDEGILECSPESQTVSVGETASFNVTALVNGQDRYYIWDAPDGTPNEAEGQGLDEFETVFDEAGEYEVNVYSMEYGNDRSTCEITVEEEVEETPTVIIEKTAEDMGTNQYGTHIKYTITWEVTGGDVSDLVITDALPMWTDVILPSVTVSPGADSTTNPSVPHLTPETTEGTHPSDASRTFTWDFNAEEAGSTGTISYTIETWNSEICSVSNTATVNFKYGEDGNGSVSDTSNTIEVPDEHCGDPDPEPTPQCSDDVDNADPEDTLVDELDPGCHSDGNAENAETYVPTDNDETDETNGGGGDTDAQCEDGVDNADPEDTLIDELDPGCHTDGNAGNETSYDPNDNDETDETDGTGDGEFPECSDGIDNTDPEDTLIDENDPGCHTDGNAGDDGTYNPADDNETDENNDNGGGGGSSRSSGSRRTSSSDGEVLGAETSCGIHVDKYLRVGYNNDAETVKKVQNFLNFYLKKNLEIDGIYGAKTEAAVREFQMLRADNVLDPWGIEDSTGIFYLTTQTEVNNILCPDLEIPIPNPLLNWSINPYVVLPSPGIA